MFEPQYKGLLKILDETKRVDELESIKATISKVYIRGRDILRVETRKFTEGDKKYIIFITCYHYSNSSGKNEKNTNTSRETYKDETDFARRLHEISTAMENDK